MEQLNSNSQKLQKNETCEKHGLYLSDGIRLPNGHVIWMRCDKCEEEARQAQKQAEEAMKIAREKAYFQECLDRSWLPKRFIGKTFENFICESAKQEKAFRVVKDYAENFSRYADEGRGLIFFGDVGTGKSHLAAAIIQHIMKENHLGLYVTVSELVRLVRDTWNRDSESTERQIIRKFVYTDLLVIDEVGKQYGTESEESILFDVLDGRYREKMPTVLMGNISTEVKPRPKFGDKQMNDLEYFLGERTADRLREINTGVVFDWESYRKAKKGLAA